MAGARITSSTTSMSGAFALMLTLVSLAMCQIAYPQEVDQESSETIEEITVYGDRSMSALRRQVYKAEANFFDVFSSLNQDDEYDVRCYYEVPSFTHIRHHVCRANFIIDATSAEAEIWRTEGPRRPISPASHKIQAKKKRLGELMETLIAERPELFQALNTYTEAKEILESERKRR